MPGSRTTLNFYTLQPARLVEWEDGELVVLLVPKFRHWLLAGWLMPRLRHPHVRVKLDALGSAVWRLCDGTRTVEAIGERLREQFGEQAEPVYDRMEQFIKKMERGDLLAIRPPSVSNPVVPAS